MAGKFEIDTYGKDQFLFRLKAPNSEIILKSEGYTTKQNCKNGIDSVKTNAPMDVRYEKKTATNGQYYFNLKAGNGEVIGTSETYVTTQGRDNGIQSVKDNAPGATVEDLT